MFLILDFHLVFGLQKKKMIFLIYNKFQDHASSNVFKMVILKFLRWHPPQPLAFLGLH